MTVAALGIERNVLTESPAGIIAEIRAFSVKNDWLLAEILLQKFTVIFC